MRRREDGKNGPSKNKIVDPDNFAALVTNCELRVLGVIPGKEDVMAQFHNQPWKKLPSLSLN